MSAFANRDTRRATRRVVRLAPAVVLALALMSSGCADGDDATMDDLAAGATPPAMALGDITGVWRAGGTAYNDVEPHALKKAYQVRDVHPSPRPVEALVPLGAIGAVPPSSGYVREGRIPYTQAGLAQREANQREWLERDPEIKCYLPGVPRATLLPYKFRIFEDGTRVLIAHEYANAVRQVYLEDPGEAPLDSWMGQSFGRVDGNSFVVEVTAQNGQTWIDRAGNPVSPQTRVTETFTPMGPDHIRYSARLEDPELYTAPWTLDLTLYRQKGTDAVMHPFECVEAVEELLYGDLRAPDVENSGETP